MGSVPALHGQLVLLDLQREYPHLREGLASENVQLHRIADGLPAILPTILITDQEGTPAWRVQYADAIQAGRIGIIGVGIGAPVDLLLPADCTPRETKLAVRLLAQIIELQRQHHQSQADRAVWMDLALRDALTGLPNRRAWELELPQRLARFPGLSVAILDVDFFKHVNEEKGHHVGDAVLRELAVALTSDLRSNDFVARLGGDEFGLILDSSDPGLVKEILDRVRTSAFQHLVNCSLPAPTLSAGYLVCSQSEAVGAEHAFASAAAALQQAKCGGRNRCVAFSSGTET